MSSTSLQTLLEHFVAEYAGSLGGRVGICTGAGTTSTLVDTGRFLGPFAASEWARGSPIRMTGAGNRAGQTGFVDSYTPATGTLTLNGTPLANAPQNADRFVIVQKHVADSIDRLIEAATRGLRRWCSRRQKIPITEIVGGDLLGSVADWTATGTATYVDEAVPDGLYSRYVHMVRAGATDTAVPAVDMAVKPGDVVDIYTYGRLFGGATSWGFRVRDATQALADIPIVYSQGAAAQSVVESWTEASGYIVIPAGCYKIRPTFNLTSGAGGMDFGPLVMARRFVSNFAAQAMADGVTRRVGSYFQGMLNRTSEAPASLSYRPVDLRCDVDNEGFGIVFRFDPSIYLPFPLFYEQLLTYGALTLDTDTTACPEDLALKAMAFEFFSWADMTERRTNQNVILRGHRISLSRWEGDLLRARDELALARRAWGAERAVVVRRAYQGRAYA